MQTLARSITVELPPETYAVIERKAKSESTTLQQALIDIIEDYIDDEEDRYLSKIADECVAESEGKYMTHEEVWGKYAQ